MRRVVTGIPGKTDLIFCNDETVCWSQNLDKCRSARLRAVPDGDGVVENEAEADNMRCSPRWSTTCSAVARKGAILGA